MSAPPPGEFRLSMASALSYVLLMTVVGVPIWWKTTEVYRVTLPYASIGALSELDFSLRVNLVLVTRDAHKDHQFGPEVQEHLWDSESYSWGLTGRAPTEEELKALARATDLAQLEQGLSKLHGNIQPGTIVLFEVEDAMFAPAAEAVTVSSTRYVFFSRRASAERLVHVVRGFVLGEGSMDKMRASIRAPTHDAARDPSVLRRTTASAGGYDLLYSLLVPQPESVMVNWDIAGAIDGYFQPFLDALGTNFSSFTVKSQVLYLTSLNVKPVRTGKLNIVSQKGLGLAINPVESQLASHVSSRPRLNFLAYVPTAEQSPLHIVNDKEDLLTSNAFLVPRWGGVAIYNTRSELKAEQQTEDMDMDAIIPIFLTQLRELLGLQKQLASDPAVMPFSRGQANLRTWERDFLYRLRTAENLLLTRVTLQSLAHLLSQISNIVINDDIGEQVFLAVEACARAEKLLKDARMEAAFDTSKVAFAAAEKAFFDPSLLALLYFPEDQKYAIYIPLFLPVFVPVLQSLRTLWSYYGKGKVKED